MSNVIESVVRLLNGSHSCFHAVAKMKKELLDAGFSELSEKEPFAIEKGGRYFLTRNGSSILAFAVPNKPALGFRLAATHNDCDFTAVYLDFRRDCV